MRIVLDTNQLVRALMRPPQLATFVMAWEARRCSVICSSALLEEYYRVLAYPEVIAVLEKAKIQAISANDFMKLLG